MEKPHLSPTQIGLLLKCPRQYFYRYVLGIKSPPSGAMAQSSSIHKAIEQSFIVKRQTGELLPEEAVLEVFAGQFDKRFSGEAGEDAPKLEADERPGKLKDQGVALTLLHQRSLAPSVSPRLIEHQFSVSLGEQFPFVLNGVIDLVEMDGQIVDNKALSRLPSQEDIAKDVQLSAYSLAYRVLEGKIEPALRLDVLLKTKMPQAKRLATQRTNGELRWFLGLVEDVARQVIAGIFPPNPTGYWCSRKFCGYYERCRGGAAMEDG